jgi:hypothetical protein
VALCLVRLELGEDTPVAVVELGCEIYHVLPVTLAFDFVVVVGELCVRDVSSEALGSLDDCVNFDRQTHSQLEFLAQQKQQQEGRRQLEQQNQSRRLASQPEYPAPPGRTGWCTCEHHVEVEMERHAVALVTTYVQHSGMALSEVVCC